MTNRSHSNIIAVLFARNNQVTPMTLTCPGLWLQLAIKGTSVMQPHRTAPSAGSGDTHAAAFSALEAGNIAPDAAFFARYHELRGQGEGQSAKKKRTSGKAGDEEEASDSDDDIGMHPSPAFFQQSR